ncbi:MAG: glycosyltransferase [Caldilineaceae bacterium]|nr:glycosyltransferase [Caldilineaceae bacterium]
MATISVIIPTLEEPLIGEVIAAASASLQRLALPHHDWEILVVGRNQALVALEQTGQWPAHLRFIDTGQPVPPGKARNLGMAAARGDWFFLLDADCVVTSAWAYHLSQRLQAGEQVVGGGICSPRMEFWPLAYNLSFFHEFLATQPFVYKRYLPTLNLALCRTVFERVGGLDEALPRAEDLQWTIRMALQGYRLCFEPQAAVAHYPRCSSLAMFWRTWRTSGYYSRVNRLAFADYYGTPGLLAYPGWLALLAPLIAGWVTINVWWRTAEVRRHPLLLPVLYLARVAWCLGAGRPPAAAPNAMQKVDNG